jgi:predicted transcriptional regulator
MPDDPKQELVVALAGPLVNVVLAAAILVGFNLAQGLAQQAQPNFDALSFVWAEDENISRLSAEPFFGATFLKRMLFVNVVLAVFNLLPAFPMDGGRVLRALLAMRLDYVQATQISAAIGQMMAFLFGFFGLFYNPFLVFVALFVWMGAAGEASMVQMRAYLEGIPVQRAMITDFRTVAPDDRMSDVSAHVIAGFQQDFPVVQEGNLVGVLTRADLVQALAQKGLDEPVANVMRTRFETAAPGEMMEKVMKRLQECDCHSLPVVQGNSIVGLITMENIGELVMLKSALGGKAAAQIANQPS